MEVVYDRVRILEGHAETIQYLPLQRNTVSVQVRRRNRQQYFFFLNTAERFFCLHNLLQKIDLGRDEISPQHLGAEEFGNEAELILQDRKGLKGRRILRLRFQVGPGRLLPVVRVRRSLDFRSHRLRKVGIAGGLKGFFQDAQHLSDGSGGHSFKSRLVVEAGAGKTFNVFGREPRTVTRKLQSKISEGTRLFIVRGKVLNTKRPAIFIASGASHDQEQAFFLPSRQVALGQQNCGQQAGLGRDHAWCGSLKSK